MKHQSYRNSIAGIILILFLLAGAAGCASVESFIEKGDLKAAEDYCAAEKAETQNPCYLKLAEGYAGRGDYVKAAESYEKGNNKAKAAESWMKEADRRLDRKEFDEAIVYFKKAGKENEGVLTVVSVLYSTKNFTKACGYLVKFDLEDRLADCYQRQANHLIGREKYQEACELLESHSLNARAKECWIQAGDITLGKIDNSESSPFAVENYLEKVFEFYQKGGQSKEGHLKLADYLTEKFKNDDNSLFKTSACEHIRKAGLPQKHLKCWEELGDHFAAEFDSKIEHSWASVSYDYAVDAYQKAGADEKLVDLKYKKKVHNEDWDFEDVCPLYAKFGKPERARQCWLKAAEICVKTKHYASAEGYFEKAGEEKKGKLIIAEKECEDYDGYGSSSVYLEFGMKEKAKACMLRQCKYELEQHKWYNSGDCYAYVGKKFKEKKYEEKSKQVWKEFASHYIMTALADYFDVIEEYGYSNTFENYVKAVKLRLEKKDVGVEVATAGVMINKLAVKEAKNKNWEKVKRLNKMSAYISKFIKEGKAK